MIDWVSGALSSAKAIGDITKSLLTLRDEALIKERVFDLSNSLMDLQQQIMTAQREQMGLLEEVTNLKKSLREAQERSSVLGRYQLLNVGPGKVLYALKSDFIGEEPEHFCCTHCFDSGKRSVMTGSYHPDNGYMSFLCLACKCIIRVQDVYIPESMRRID